MTKRSLLSDINSVYDPIGLTSPVLILGKIFIQQLWGMKMSWDDILPIELQSRWINFYKSLQSLHDLAIPRKVVSTAESRVTIHGFCDASQEAFGACIYLRSSSPNGQVQVHLMASKSRVTPMKATTILDWNCVVPYCSELLLEVKNELNCLAWLKNEVPLQTYAANRVARILDGTIYTQWRHVSSKENSANLITRGRWLRPTRNIKVGDLCLLRQENLPPTKWALARVQNIHSGTDGTVRVVTLRNSSGHIFKCPVVKLSLLPNEEDEIEQ